MKAFDLVQVFRSHGLDQLKRVGVLAFGGRSAECVVDGLGSVSPTHEEAANEHCWRADDGSVKARRELTGVVQLIHRVSAFKAFFLLRGHIGVERLLDRRLDMLVHSRVRSSHAFVGSSVGRKPWLGKCDRSLAGHFPSTDCRPGGVDPQFRRPHCSQEGDLVLTSHLPHLCAFFPSRILCLSEKRAHAFPLASFADTDSLLNGEKNKINK